MAVTIITALKSYGSDRVQDTLNEIRRFNFALILVPLANFFEGELLNCKDGKTKAEYVYGVPLFCCPEETETPKMKMSCAVKSIINRTCIKIKKCIHFDIYFEHFIVDEELKSLNDFPVINTDNYNEEDISLVLADAVRESFR